MNQRTSFGTMALAAGASVLSLTVLSGCDNSCYSDLTCPPWIDEGGSSGTGGTGSSETVCPDDPIAGPVAERCGVWVSASLGDDSNSGTQTAPVKTLGAAISLAIKGPARVYACGETYPEAVSLPSGVSLFGGFACKKRWAYEGSGSRAVITPAAPGVALQLTIGDSLSRIRDLKVAALDATAPGESSIAVFALPGSKADIRRVSITAGNGVKGEDGENGKFNGEPAKKGIAGINGGAACSMDPGLGGAAVFLQCANGAVSKSGQGGDGGEQSANDGAEGLQPPNPNPQGYGAGGKGEGAGAGQSCTPGIGGAQGADGANGLGSLSSGRLTLQGYLGAAGEDGMWGLPGQGGGGGGASRGSASCGATFHGGAAGGSGGSGGCGGRPGKGGQAGGSSIAVALLSDAIFLTDVDLQTGNGGDGGNGGTPEAGGQGGLPGVGGSAVGGVDVQAGCAGGAGGYGGKGGNGAGGHGGHSVSFAFTVSNNPTVEMMTPKWGNPGHFGFGGDPASIPALGQYGNASSYVVLEP